MKVRCSAEDLASIRARAGKEPVGPWLVRTALGKPRPMEVAFVDRAKGEVTAVTVPETPEEDLDRWEARWLPSVRKTAPNFALVTSALQMLRKALG